VSNTSGTENPAGGLEGLRAGVAAGNPDLYRHIALYLQVLRSVLPGRVEQACFHLATQVHVQRYLQLPARRRRELHRLLRERVARCSSLLTVEQLVALARRLEEEQQHQQHRRQQELVQRLLQKGGPQEDTPQSPSEPGPQEATRPEDATLPPGSVRLGLAPPLDVSGLHWTLGHSAAAMAGDPWGDTDGRTAGDGENDHRDDEPLRADAAEESGEHAAESDSGSDDDASRQEEADAAELMAALIEGLLETGALEGGTPETDGESTADASGAALADGTAQGPAAGRQAPQPEGPRSGHPGGMDLVPGGGSDPEPAGLLLEAGLSPAEGNGTDIGSPWQEPGLPQDPLLLLRWLDGLEAALTRRLRNLSHAINVDLLRLGLTRGLLPVSLLEAVLQGQIETLASPSNVLRLQLPFGLRPDAPPLQAIAILLRPIDLEMEEPRLRTCRRRIHQHRQQVRKMAQTYRRLQRRLQAHEAERLWLQDLRASRKPNT
jgi:hypothetical protein